MNQLKYKNTNRLLASFGPKISKCKALILGLLMKLAAVQSDLLLAQRSSALHLIGQTGGSRQEFEFVEVLIGRQCWSADMSGLCLQGGRRGLWQRRIGPSGVKFLDF